MRILGITLPDDKKVSIGLTHLHGIGHSRASDICEAAGVDAGKKCGELTTDEDTALREQIEQFNLEGDLKREVSGNIKRLKDIRSYRGMRDTNRLPSRGQRTKTNSRTVRGNKRQTQSTGRRSSA